MSNKPICIIYIPGLGDAYDPMRRFLLRFWRIYGVKVQMVASRWSDGGDLEGKMSRVTQAVAAEGKGYEVVLVGESAGGSLALTVYAEISEQVYRVVTICGKNSNPHNVSPALYRRHPAFHQSMQQVGGAVEKLTMEQRRRVTSIFPLHDSTVPVSDTLIPDCRRVRLFSVGHGASILFALTLASFVLVREARRPR